MTTEERQQREEKTTLPAIIERIFFMGEAWTYCLFLYHERKYSSYDTEYQSEDECCEVSTHSETRDESIRDEYHESTDEERYESECQEIQRSSEETSDRADEEIHDREHDSDDERSHEAIDFDSWDERCSDEYCESRDEEFYKEHHS